MIEKTSAGMNQGMINKLITVLEATLSKLSRYDEGSLIGSILSLTVFASFNNLMKTQNVIRVTIHIKNRNIFNRFTNCFFF